MTIRVRLTLWYGGIMLVSLGVLAGVLHHEWAEQTARLRDDRKAPPLPWNEAGEVALFYGLPTVLLLVAGGSLLLRKSLRPITTLTQAAERIHADNLKEQLPLRGTGDELDRLTEVFNAMTARLDDSFGRVREFTLHASHELKTPLTVMRAEIESTLQHSDCDPTAREVFSNQLDEIQRLTRIIDGLTMLAKADAGQVTLKNEPVRFDELVDESFADAQILAQPGQIQVALEQCDAAQVRGDRHRLRQLLLNLTDNAVKYNRPGGRVTISLRCKGPAAELQIANSGIGIPAALLPRVFDRFFRGDASHNGEIEGCGLGLSIAEWIVKAHNGSIQIASEPEKLTTVTVSLPLMAG